MKPRAKAYVTVGISPIRSQTLKHREGNCVDVLFLGVIFPRKNRMKIKKVREVLERIGLKVQSNKIWENHTSKMIHTSVKNSGVSFTFMISDNLVPNGQRKD